MNRPSLEERQISRSAVILAWKGDSKIVVVSDHVLLDVFEFMRLTRTDFDAECRLALKPRRAGWNPRYR